MIGGGLEECEVRIFIVVWGEENGARLEIVIEFFEFHDPD